uniref:Uncharacterized protein n=1 Tax=Brassica oleracea TaxID=3712 RepID=A0A3P6F9X3_BRAOL|nr:unnamed protein product [Brassica oleracea]
MPVLLPVSFHLIILSMLIIISLWIVLIRPSVLTHPITPTSVPSHSWSVWPVPATVLMD